MLRDHFRKEQNPPEVTEGPQRTSQVPDGMFRKCERCKKVLYEEDIVQAAYCCPECGKHFRIDPYTRIALVADRDSFEEWDSQLAGDNPLEFPGYEEKLETLRETTGLREAVVTGAAKIAGIRTAIGAMSADFLMGSMGTAVGEKITRMVERATQERLPVVLFCCSGGARMQEGILSLMQMAKTAQALKQHDEEGLLYVSVLTDPTTGGVTASFAMLGDVILAEPEALIGFAGARVIRQTIGGKLPEGFQSAEFLQKHGFVDRIVKRDQMRRVLTVLLRSCMSPMESPPPGVGGRSHCSIRNASRWSSADKKQYARAADLSEERASCGAAENPSQKAAECQDTAAPSEAIPQSQSAGASADFSARRTAWERVQLARDANRPYAKDYISKLFSGFLELRGDRLYGDDRAVIGGIAAIDGIYVTVIGQQKGRNTKQNRHRNYGMMNPDGYRKALRLMKQAEKFRRPIILLIDTPGAFCGVEAEERGQGEAIARNLYEMAGLTVPILSIVTGEGGSGGALALAVANEVWMLENSVYSILSPEGFAAILWKDGKRAPEAAESMKLTAEELLKFGVIEKIIPEEVSADKDDMDGLVSVLRSEILSFLSRYREKAGEEIAKERYQRFRRF